jgi:hypothetical protein
MLHILLRRFFPPISAPVQPHRFCSSGFAVRALFLCCWIVSSAAYGQITDTTASDADIFAQLQAIDNLHIIIETDLQLLTTNRQRKGKTAWQPAALLAMEGQRLLWRRTIEIAPRGVTRRALCARPPIKLRFQPTDTASETHELKIVTNCFDSPEGDALVAKECLAYQLYNVLTDESLRTKPARFQFRDTNGSLTTPHFAYFLEPFDALAARIGAKPLKGKNFNPQLLRDTAYDRICLFQYLLGNTDWNSYNGHNFKVFSVGDRYLTATPYDFDYSGFVNAPYAAVPANLPIKTVRDRYYFGFCRPVAAFQPVIGHFQAKKAQLLQCIATYPHIDETTRQHTADYVVSFFELLDEPLRWRIALFGRCR